MQVESKIHREWGSSAKARAVPVSTHTLAERLNSTLSIPNTKCNIKAIHQYLKKNTVCVAQQDALLTILTRLQTLARCVATESE